MEKKELNLISEFVNYRKSHFIFFALEPKFRFKDNNVNKISIFN